MRQPPISLQRFPDGIEGFSFFEKKVPSHFPDFVATVEVDTADGPQHQVRIDAELGGHRPPHAQSGDDGALERHADQVQLPQRASCSR